MGKIRILDPDVAGRIAAGEVVDRPSTLLKELLENALDAKATRIDVEIEGGGIDRIAVSDNGCGMEEADAVLALERHATSKILALSDLERIASFGFRGEALASIAAVGKLELVTCESAALRGTRLYAEGGEIKEKGSVGAPQGTRIVAGDLFFNVPARRKFLKSIVTEEMSCLDIFGKMALAKTDVAFSAKKNGKLLFTLPAGESLIQRYQRLFPGVPPNRLFPLDSARDFVRVSGLIGAPPETKSTRNSIFFYVNHRIIRPGVLSQAVLDGYSGYLQPGRFPVAVLFLEIDGKRVDVNVHPTKAEVRFSHPREIYALIEKAIAAGLAGIQEEIRPRVAALAFGEPSQSYGSSGVATARARYEDLTLFEKLTPLAFEEKRQPVLLAMIAKTYALFREGETLTLVDLHGAHERINYDVLEKRFETGVKPAQELLTPMLFTLSAQERALLEKYRAFLEKVGLSIEEFGNDSVRVRAIPLGFEKFGEKAVLLSLIGKLEKIDEVKGPEDLDRKILATLACRSSVQAGDDVKAPEAESIFEKVLQSSTPYYCPHGRPILLKLTLEEVHRLFRRTWS